MPNPTVYERNEWCVQNDGIEGWLEAAADVWDADDIDPRIRRLAQVVHGLVTRLKTDEVVEKYNKAVSKPK